MIRNKKTGQMYIGQSKNIEKRFRSHCNMLDIDKAILLEGEDNFDFIVIEEVDESLLREREEYWIHHYNTMYNREHYNKEPNREHLKHGYGRDNPAAKYILWDISSCTYHKDKRIENKQAVNKCFTSRYKGAMIPIGLFHDFVSCEIINQLIKEAIKDEVK